MKDPIQRAIERFPEAEDTIRRLGESSANLSAACEAFSVARDELHRVKRSPEADAEIKAEQSRRRCADLEDELLAMVQQNVRV